MAPIPGCKRTTTRATTRISEAAPAARQKRRPHAGVLLGRAPTARLVGLCLVSALAAACLSPRSIRVEPGAGAACYRDARPSMGSLLQVTLCGAGPAAETLARQIFVRVAQLDALLTTWAAEGPMLRFNAAAGHGPQVVAPELYAALRDARDWAARTGGAFDPTIGPVLELWRAAGRLGAAPAPSALVLARQRSGFLGLRVYADGRAELLREGMSVDLGAIGKGWALERIVAELALPAGAALLLDFGGSSYLARGAPPGDSAWRVEIRRGDGALAAVVELRDQALSVSGALGRMHRVDGVERSHIIDPRTGAPVASARFAIVVADDGSAAEAISTALVVLDESAGRALVQAEGVQAQLWDGDVRPGGGYSWHFS